MVQEEGSAQNEAVKRGSSSSLEIELSLEKMLNYLCKLTLVFACDGGLNFYQDSDSDKLKKFTLKP